MIAGGSGSRSRRGDYGPDKVPGAGRFVFGILILASGSAIQQQSRAHEGLLRAPDKGFCGVEETITERRQLQTFTWFDNDSLRRTPQRSKSHLQHLPTTSLSGRDSRPDRWAETPHSPIVIMDTIRHAPREGSGPVFPRHSDRLFFRNALTKEGNMTQHGPRDYSGHALGH
jgi:hypothetical protein